ANLEAPQELRLNVLSIMNRTMMVTAHGQTSDIMNEVTADVTIENIEKVLEWKTACYTLLNPLHVGMVFAGADCHATDAITPYAMAVGKAFQLTDDVVGIFGSTEESGKSPLDDIREGKRTILMAYALEHADKSDRNFLIQMLGNRQLKPAEFERCKAILLESGAVKHTKSLAEQFVHEAQQALDKEAGRWSNDGIQFLHGLADYLLNRSA
ncbi:MAG TPA: polyprenyl synthetase family protein, partial [Patescibacteria group bacterium]|nr:polyprenyl synthetase family protein [Patescibacteria group bacterium]